VVVIDKQRYLEGAIEGKGKGDLEFALAFRQKKSEVGL